jgi:DNA-binding phage protein
MSKAKVRVLKPYKTYRFTGQDPMVGKVLDACDAAGVKNAVVARESGVASTTLGNWRKRKTKRPQFATLNATLMALGKELTITNRK